MTEERPQPQRPPRKEIEGGNARWLPRPDDADEPDNADDPYQEAADNPAVQPADFRQPGYGQFGDGGFGERLWRPDPDGAGWLPPGPQEAPDLDDQPAHGFVPTVVPGPSAPPEGGNGQAGRGLSDDPAGGRRPFRRRNNTDPSEEVDPQSAALPADTIKIGIWGPPGSGKTTYLAALQHATLNRGQSPTGEWAIFPRTPASEVLLTEWTQRLLVDQTFPDANDPGDWRPLRWRLIGDLTGSRYMRRRGLRRPDPESQFDLELIDVSGEVFGYDPAGNNVADHIVQRMLDHLAAADGLIFLFDPITERNKPSISTYVSRVLNNLLRRMLDANRMYGRFLPHHISVCITKTDDPELMRNARAAGLVNTDGNGVDRVLDEEAKELFDRLCDGNFWGPDDRGHGGARFVRNQLQKYFAPEHTRYYAISAIGYQEITRRNGKPTIVGPIEPFNVLEPLVELHMQLQRRA